MAIEYTTESGTKELSWASYALDGRAHPRYFLSEKYFESFPPGSVVADIGCGDGRDLQQLLDRGCRGIGTEVGDSCLRGARQAGRPVAKAGAEALPIASNSVDAVVFGGVLPFTEEDEAFAEIARILRPGGQLQAYYLGVGYAVRDLLFGVSLRNRYFGLRALLNTVLIHTIGRKLPGRFGDTVYTSHRRLAQLYARHGLALKTLIPSPTFLGLPVFIYHAVERVGAAERLPGPAPRRSAVATADRPGMAALEAEAR